MGPQLRRNRLLSCGDMGRQDGGWIRSPPTVRDGGDSGAFKKGLEEDRTWQFIEAVSNGWPTILSSLKSLLETGDALEDTRNR